MKDRTEVSAFVDLLVNYNNIDKVKYYNVPASNFGYDSAEIITYIFVGYVGAFCRTLKISVKYAKKMW